MSLEEVARATRVPLASMERIEAGQFDELPGEVFVRGFLRSYARAVEISGDEVLARYTASRRMAWVTPLPIMSPVRSGRSGRFGVAIAFVLLLFLFALALSIVLKPRSHDMPQELSLLGSPALLSGQPCVGQPCVEPCAASGSPGDGRA
jgi:cytoskeletal protein RodZ